MPRDAILGTSSQISTWPHSYFDTRKSYKDAKYQNRNHHFLVCFYFFSYNKQVWKTPGQENETLQEFKFLFSTVLIGKKHSPIWLCCLCSAEGIPIKGQARWAHWFSQLPRLSPEVCTLNADLHGRLNVICSSKHWVSYSQHHTTATIH